MVHILAMPHVPLSEAKGRLAELVRRAEAGEEVVVTRNGHEVVELVRRRPRLSREEKVQLIRKLQKAAQAKLPPDFDAARSQDFLYGDDGLPG
ncbi:MAG: type II toxin-antitoxin system Phd/YefM family antitoxin [Brevundimonas sp.]|uniref:type II toxin-antitoxin system Phd/YefM family antitoxin n=1 Tax=Brevundimonas sp. TaxID=1871086 RepID=UPI00391BDB12